MNNFDTRFDTILSRLRDRGGMYLFNFSYETLIAYIFGYTEAMTALGHSDPLEGFPELIYLKFGASCALHWTALLQEYLATNDEHAIEVFFTCYDQLKEIKQQHGIEFLRSEYARMEHFKRKRKTNIHWPLREKDVEKNR